MRSFLLLILPAVVVVSFIKNARGQSATTEDTSPPKVVLLKRLQPIVVLSKLSQPAYPPLARTARITGDVVVKLGIRKDGSVESAVVVNGHPMFTAAALDSAQHSQYECRNCNDDVTSYLLTYSFEISSEAPPVEEAATIATFSPSENLVSVMTDPMPIICALRSNIGVRVRSPKCLYLWRCGLRQLN